MKPQLLLPQPEDELVHAPAGDESLPWKDTWYFSLLDEAAGIHLAMHMTVSANRVPDTRVAVGIRDGARERVLVRRVDGTHTAGAIGNDLARLEVVHLSWDSAHELRWCCQADDVAFAISVRGVHFAPDWDAMFPGFNPSGKLGHSYAHTEQVIRGEGWIRWRGEERRPVTGFGWRDRGWGRRKTEATFGSGYDLVGGILPDGSAFAFQAMRNIETAQAERQPVAGFLTDERSLVPAVGGIYYKDSMSFPARLDLEFADGRRVTGNQVRRLSTLGTPFHEAEPERSGIAHGARDYYAALVDPGGAEFAVFSNEGHMLRADVTRDARFFSAS